MPRARPDRRRARAHPDPRRRHGHADPGPRPRRGRLPRPRFLRLRLPPQQGNNDLLILTQPEAIEEIHYRYAIAGADIVETNTFSSTSIAQADYGMQERGLRAEPRRRARSSRSAADRAEAEDGRRRFVAGALGPTNRTASMSPGRERPRLPRRHLRRPARRLCRADARPDRRRRRPPPDRDDLRHAERQGRDLRLRARSSPRRARACR